MNNSQDMHLAEILNVWSTLPAQTKLDLEHDLAKHLAQMSKVKDSFFDKKKELDIIGQEMAAFDKAFMEWAKSWLVKEK